MSLGDVSNVVQTGGGLAAANAANLARTPIVLNVSPLGAVNTAITVAQPGSIGSLLDTGPLAEEVALLLKHGAPQVIAVPVNQSGAGGTSAVVQIGTGTGTASVTTVPHKVIDILCVTGGSLGTATFQFRVGGAGNAYGPVIPSSAGPWTYRVPGTFVTLSFAVAVYVATKTNNISTTGVVTPGAAWVGVVTLSQVDPIDAYEVILTVNKGGAVGTAILGVSLDNGISQQPQMLTASSLVIPGTGLMLSLGSTFTVGDVYSFLSAPPSFSTSDVTNAMNAVTALPTINGAVVHQAALPSTASGAFSVASTLDSSLSTALVSYRNWQGVSECPSSVTPNAPPGTVNAPNAGGATGDIINSSGTVSRDATNTDSVIITARAGQETKRVAVCAGTHRMTSPLTGRKHQRPYGWAVLCRLVETDPAQSVAQVSLGKLDIYAIGRDEFATPGLDDAGLNVARTYFGQVGAFHAITSGMVGFKNLTTDASMQDADAVRVLDVLLNAITPAAQLFLGQRPTTNADGTIEERQARQWDTLVNSVAQRAVGLQKGGSYSTPQASSCTASIDRSSQLGASPRLLKINYSLQPLGFVSAVTNTVRFAGVLTFGA